MTRKLAERVCKDVGDAVREARHDVLPIEHVIDVERRGLCWLFSSSARRNIKYCRADELNSQHTRPHPGLARRDGANCYVIGAAGAHFALERWTLAEPHVEPAHARRCMTLSNVGDPVQLGYAGGTETFGRAESCILPAAIGEVRVTPGGESSLIACYIPDLARDIIAPLRAAGHTNDAIRTLGAVNP